VGHGGEENVRFRGFLEVHMGRKRGSRERWASKTRLVYPTGGGGKKLRGTWGKRETEVTCNETAGSQEKSANNHNGGKRDSTGNRKGNKFTAEKGQKKRGLPEKETKIYN